MIRFWFPLSIVLSIVWIVLMIVVITIGTLLPPHPTLAGFEQCEDLPCWLNIDLYQHTPYQALDILAANGYITDDDINYLPPENSSLCDLVVGTGVTETELRLNSIQLLNCHDLRLGDVLSAFGTPAMVTRDDVGNWIIWYDNTIAVIVHETLLPQSVVSQIAFYNLEEFGILPCGVPWHGFITQWRYNQLEGDIRDC